MGQDIEFQHGTTVEPDWLQEVNDHKEGKHPNPHSQYLLSIEPFGVKGALYDAENNRLIITIAKGRASFPGGTVVKTEDSNFYVNEPATGTTYYIYLLSDGSFAYNTMEANPGSTAGSILLTTIITGSTLVDALTIAEKRPQLDGTASALSAHLADYTNQIGILFDLVYTPPVVVLSLNPNVTVKEYGDNIASIALTAVITKKVQDITNVEFYRASSLLHTVDSPNPDGGTESFTENNVINNTVTFKAKAYDVKGSVESSKTISYVYPFFIGNVDTASPSEAQVKALAKLVKTKGTTVQAFTLNSSRFCIAYPQAYGVLASILDQNNFETIASYTQTSVDVTGLDGTTQPYNVYTLNNITTQTNFTNTFKF